MKKILLAIVCLAVATKAQNKKTEDLIKDIDLTIENLQIYLNKDQAEKIKLHNDIFIRQMKSEYKQIHNLKWYWTLQFQEEKKKASDSLDKLCPLSGHRWQYLATDGQWENLPENYNKNRPVNGKIVHFRAIATDSTKYCIANAAWDNDSDLDKALYPASLKEYKRNDYCDDEFFRHADECEPKGLRLDGFEKVMYLFPELRRARYSKDKFNKLETDFRSKAWVLYRTYFGHGKHKESEEILKIISKLSYQYEYLLERVLD